MLLVCAHRISGEQTLLVIQLFGSVDIGHAHDYKPGIQASWLCPLIVSSHAKGLCAR